MSGGRQPDSTAKDRESGTVTSPGTNVSGFLDTSVGECSLFLSSAC